MPRQTVSKIIEAAISKAELVNYNPLKYFILAMMAGVYVGFGVMLVFSIAAPFHAVGSPAVKLLMGASFAVALSLVIFASSELFTGNNMVMTIGSLSRKVAWKNTWQVWVMSYLGNLVGSLLLAFTLVQSGLVTKSPVKDFFLEIATIKINAPFSELLIRGILCNILVCLAVWICFKIKEEVAKLVMIFWCLFAFVGSGFEHSVANMTLLGISVLLPHDPAVISWLGYIKNLVPVSIGNLIGGAIFIGLAYWYIAKEKTNRSQPSIHPEAFDFLNSENSGESLEPKGFHIPNHYFPPLTTKKKGIKQ